MENDSSCGNYFALARPFAVSFTWKIIRVDLAGLVLFVKGFQARQDVPAFRASGWVANENVLTWKRNIMTLRLKHWKYK